MASKRRADRTEPPKPGEQVRAVVAPPAPGRFDRLVARLKTLKGAVVAIAGVGAVLGGLAGYWNAYQAARGSTESSKLLALVGKGDAGPLSIVVLPFANLTGDPQQAYLADGLTAAVTSDLSRIRDAFIVSTATAFAYKDRPLTVQQIGKELGVRFALQGGVQRSGEKIRINAQLADTTTNAQLWSESFDGSQGDLFDLQELVTTRIGNSIWRATLTLAARESVTTRGNAKAADLMLRARGIWLKQAISLEDYREAEALYRQILALEPQNAQAMAGLAVCLTDLAFNRFIPDAALREQHFVEGYDLALKAKQLNPNIAGIYGVLQMHATKHGDLEGARRAGEKALSLHPKEPLRYSNLANYYYNVADPKRAIELLSKGIRLDPRNLDDSILINMGAAQFMLGDDAAAIEWLHKAIDVSPSDPLPRAFLAMAYARRGDHGQSRDAVAAVLRANPKFGLLEFERPEPSSPVAYREFWEKKLLPAGRLAGLPE